MEAKYLRVLGYLNRISWSHPLLATLVISWSWSLLELKECLLRSQLAGQIWNATEKEQHGPAFLKDPQLTFVKSWKASLSQRSHPDTCLCGTVGTLALWTWQRQKKPPWQNRSKTSESPKAAQHVCCPHWAPHGEKRCKNILRSLPAPAEPSDCRYQEDQAIQKSYSKRWVWKHLWLMFKLTCSRLKWYQNDTSTERNTM